MARFIEIILEKRNVRCVARLLDDDAPITAGLVWSALPLGGDVFHAKYASNEIYCLVPPIEGEAPGLENSTIVPIPGDVVYFDFPARHIARSFRAERGLDHLPSLVDLAVFYGRNNLLLSPSLGPTPGNVFATITENLAEMAAACNDVWLGGGRGERLIFRRL